MPDYSVLYLTDSGKPVTMADRAAAEYKSKKQYYVEPPWILRSHIGTLALAHGSQWQRCAAVLSARQ
jgi:hypothetical protein